MKKLALISLILVGICYMSSCNNEDDSGIQIIRPVDSTSTAKLNPEQL